jgi:hypothetical protein
MIKLPAGMNRRECKNGFCTRQRSALPPANLTFFLPQSGQKKEICRVDQL